MEPTTLQGLQTRTYWRNWSFLNVQFWPLPSLVHILATHRMEPNWRDLRTLLWMGSYIWFWFHESITYDFFTLILWSKGDLFIHLQWCSLKERNHSHVGRLQKPVFAPSNFFSEVALPFDQNLSMVTQYNTLFSHAIWNTISTYDMDAWQNNCWNYVTDINTQCTFSSIFVWLQKMK